MADRIIVPLDGSSFAEHALPAALEIADRSGARVELVTVVERPDDLDSVLDGHGVTPTEGAQQYLARIADGIESSREGEIERAVISGAPARSLLDRVNEIRADLVVLSSHGHGPLSQFWLGSVTDEFVRRSPCPVLVVRPPEGEEADPTAELSVKKILVPVNALRDSPHVPDPVVELASLFDAELHLFTVVPTTPFPGTPKDPALGAGSPPDRERTDRALADAETRLEEVAERLAKDHGRTVEHATVKADNVPARIIRRAEEVEADLIGIAARDRGAISRLLLGSVVDKVLRASSIPVLLTQPAPKGSEDFGYPA